MQEFHPYDPVLAESGLLEAVIEDYIVGWDFSGVRESAWEPVYEIGTHAPQAWVPGTDWELSDVPPKPITRQQVRWRFKDLDVQ